MAINRKKNTPISPWIIALVVLGCAAAAWFLLPSERSIVERQVRDGQNEEALKTLDQIPEEQKRTDPLFYLLTDLRLKESQLKPGDTKIRDELISKAGKGASEHDYNPDILDILVRLLRDHPNPERALELSGNWLPRFPVPTQEQIVNGLVAGFLAENKPGVAAKLYLDLASRLPASEKRLVELIRLSRLAGTPGEALSRTTEFLNQTSPERVPALAKLHIELLRENQQPEKAFAAVKELYQKSDAEARKELYQLLLTLAGEVNQAGEILQEVEAHAASHPGDIEAWVSYREIATAANKLDHAIKAAQTVVSLKPNSGPELYRLGQLSEWNRQPGGAFEAYMAALKLKEVKAGERIFDLAPGLGRELEASELFNSFPEFIRENSLEFRMARLNETSGNFDEADRWYKARLERVPDDFPTIKAYSQFLLGLYDYQKAAEMLEKGQKLAPNDPEITAFLTEAYYRNGDYEKAHSLLEIAVHRSGNDRVLDDLLTLSESLQRTDSLVNALKLKNAGPGATPDDLRKLASIYERPGRTSELVESLKAGILRYPSDPELRIRLADHFLNRGDFLEGVKVLQESELVKTNLAAMQIYLQLLLQGQKFADADSFYTAHVPAAARETEVFLGLRAAIAENLERKSEAAQIYRKLHGLKPDNINYALNYARLLADNGKTREALALLEKYSNNPAPETMKLMAQALATAGRYKEAEAWQLRYLRSAPSDLAKAYGFLGDVRLSRGDKINAKRAYEKGLENLLKEIGQPNNPAAAERADTAKLNRLQ